jgi:hypothetical protein
MVPSPIGDRSSQSAVSLQFSRSDPKVLSDTC